MAAWKDINGDGLMDILTARATKPIFGTARKKVNNNNN